MDLGGGEEGREGRGGDRGREKWGEEQWRMRVGVTLVLCVTFHSTALPSHLVDGLQTALLSAALDPAVGPQVLHIL